MVGSPQYAAGSGLLGPSRESFQIVTLTWGQNRISGEPQGKNRLIIEQLKPTSTVETGSKI